MTDSEETEIHANNTTVQTGGKMFSDGSMLELIRLPNGELRLLSWNGTRARIAGQFQRGDEIFVPLRVDPTISRSLQLPANIAQYGSTRKLYTEISSLISQTIHVGNGVALPLTFAVFATWLADCFSAAPFVWIVAPPTTSAAPLAQLLGLLCRRALIVSDISSLKLHSLPLDLAPTLLTEISQPTRRVLNLLRASKRHGALIGSGGKAIDPFCAKIVFAHEPLRDPATAGFPLELVLPPARKYLPLMTSSEAERITTEFQGKLLRYRMLNRAKVRAPAFEMSQFTVPLQELAYALAASVVGDDELQSQIVPFLKSLDSAARVDRESLLPSVVLDVLLARCHSATVKNIPIGTLTREVNTVLLGRGSALEVSPENIGWVLRGLGLHTEFLTGGRKGLVLQNDVRKKVHELAESYGVRTLRELPANIGCPLCAARVPPLQAKAHPAGGK